MNNKIYHITTLTEWKNAQNTREYQPQNFCHDGFIHCSERHQLLKVANRFFFGQTDLVILVINTQKIAKKIIYENLEGGTELYPHFYSKLPLQSVIKVIIFPCEIDGTFKLPSL